MERWEAFWLYLPAISESPARLVALVGVACQREREGEEATRNVNGAYPLSPDLEHKLCRWIVLDGNQNVNASLG